MSDVKNSSLATGLVSYWELEEASGTRVDSHASNDLTPVNAPSSAAGIQGDGVDLERGSSQYLSVAHASQTGLKTTGDTAVSMWVKVENQVAAGSIEYQLYNRYLPSGNNRCLSYTYIHNGGSYALQVITSNNGSSIAYGNRSQTLTPGSLYHLVFNYDASAGAVEIFVNGSSIGSVTGQRNSLYADSAPVEIGAQNGNYQFDGVIDEVGVWSRVLSPSEISDLAAGIPYDAGGGPTGYANTVIGVTSANIGKVTGVATANISKVMGV